MSLVYLETARFVVRQWSEADAPALYALFSDQRVHIYTGDKPWTLERAQKYIRLMLDKDFRTLDAFHGACVLKDGQTLTGYTGLNPYLPDQPELEWQLGVAHWGHGYATELGKAVIAAAFHSTPIQRIFGMVNPLNKASLRVMKKIGMTCLGLREFRGEEDMFFQIERGPGD